MKSVLLSIKPKYCELIASGKKTIEVRKTKPKLDTPFKCCIYCTHNGSSAKEKDRNLYTDFSGKVIGEFVCDEIIEILLDNEIYGIYDISDDEVIASCLVNGDLWDYGKGKTLYGWHISNLVIYDKLKEITHFLKPCKCDFDIEKCMGCENLSYNDLGGECCDRRITRPPQSWCYVESEADTE